MIGDKIWLRLSRSRAIFVCALGASLFVLSCQSSSTAPQKPSGPQTIQPSFGINATYKVPDSAVWRFKTDSGRSALLLVNGAYQASVTISSPLERDTFWMDIYAAGIREMRLPFVADGNGAPKVADRSQWYDFTALAILRGIDSLALVGKPVVRNKGGAASVYAAMLIGGDSNATANGLSNLPKGLDSALVLDSILSKISKSGQPFRSYTTILVSVVDTTSAKIRVSALVKIGALSISDSASLFPPYPVRVAKPILLDSVLVAGGGWKSVTGAFVADRGVVGVSVRVYRDQADLTTSFEVNNTVATESRPISLEFGQNLSLRAADTTKPGLYRLRVAASDDSARVAASEFVFRVAPPADETGPKLIWVAPLDGSIFEFSDSTLTAKIIANDPSGVDSVWIAGKLAMKSNDTFSVQVVVPVSEAGYVLGARSVDRIGNPTSSSVRVGRRDGVVRKQILSPAQNATEPFDSASVMVRWKVVDPRSKIDTVWMGGAVATPENDSVWRARVPLALNGTATVIGLTAKTAKGDQLVDFISVTRDLDKIGPSLSFTAPAPGAVMEYDTASVVVKVKAVDPSDVDSVRIAGIKAALVNGDWTSSVSVPVGTTLQIHVSAYDKRANRTDTSISVTRKGPPDNLAPVITLLWPSVKQGTVVPFDSAAVTLRWVVTDAFGIVDTGVRINGKLSSRSGDTFALRVALLPSGQPLSFRIDVNNIKKGSAFDAVSLARASDTVRPKIARVGAFPSVVLNDSSAITLAWKVTDNHRLGILKSGDSTLSVKDSLYTIRVPLKIGSNSVGIKVWDSTGNLAGDSLSIVRAAQRPHHDLDSGHFVRYWKTLHITSTESDSLQWSLDGATWNRYKDSVRVDCDSCRILSRAWPGPSAVDTTGIFWIRKVKSVAAGGYHSMFLLTNGTVWACGKNNSGRIGDGTYEMRTVPVRVMQDGLPMTDVEEIYGGGHGSLFVKKNRDLYGVGSPASQMIDPANTQLASPVKLGGNVSKISFWDNAIWLTPQGTVMGFGISPSWYEDSVVVYDEQVIMYDKASRIPWSGVVDVANGYSGQYILDSRRGLFTAIDGWSDSLQKSTYPPPFSVLISNLPGVLKHIEVDWYGRLYGINEQGGLYELTQTEKLDSLVAVEIHKSAKSYALGTTLYVLTAEGKVFGRGANDFGQLATGSSSQVAQTEFIQVFPDKVQMTYSQISTGYTHAIALGSDGSVFVVGGNEHGQLGNGTTMDQYAPIQVNF
ncbi:MAG: hypothetical protein RL173_1322 [Fibrobacterota bacterium]